MRHLFYDVRLSVVRVNFLTVNRTVSTTTKYSVPLMTQLMATVFISEFFYEGVTYTVGYDKTNECYSEQVLSIKLRCYNERGGILSVDVARACA
jgi:hypothetical protein